ncbi:MAG: DUF1330 domain-containing protein [Chloroflexi bacterium]|nr:MAG: DUF1330 domain-containing protein [Chloroflexota bacterium]
MVRGPPHLPDVRAAGGGDPWERRRPRRPGTAGQGGGEVRGWKGDGIGVPESPSKSSQLCASSQPGCGTRDQAFARREFPGAWVPTWCAGRDARAPKGPGAIATHNTKPLFCGVHIARRETRMSAHVVVHFNLKDEELWKAYGQAAGPLVAAHGGKMISRGPSEVLSGALDRASMVIIEFPDRASAKRWYTSPEYQAIIPNRDAGMDSIFIVGGE